jgi:hypothetical protein
VALTVGGQELQSKYYISARRHAKGRIRELGGGVRKSKVFEKKRDCLIVSG